MPNMANIVVKKADGTTNYTFSSLSASPGDGGFAQWRGEGSSPALAASLRAKSSWNGTKTTRRVEASGNYPYVQTVSGIDTVTSFGSFRFTSDVPMNMPAAVANDFAAVMANAIASALFKEMVATGIAAT